MRKLLFGFILCFLFGCNRKHTEENILKIQGSRIADDIELISVSKEMICENLKYSDFIDSTSIELIPLETMEESLLLNVSQLEIRDEYVYLKDDKQKAIFIFSNKGKYIDKIECFGSGLGEYNFFCNFCILKNQIAVLDFNKIIWYDNACRNSVKIVDLDSLGIGALDMYVDNKHFYLRPSNIKALTASVIVCDTNYNVTSVFVQPGFEKLTGVVYPPFFIPIEDKVYYHQIYNDTLYEITNSALLARYVFDCGDHGLSYEKLTEFRKTNNIPDHYIHSLQSFYYADSMIYFLARGQGENYCGLYSFRSKNLKLIDYINSEDDIFNLGLSWFARKSTPDGFFYSLIFPSQLKQGRRMLKFASPFVGVTQNSNPVLLKYKFKAF